MSKKLKRKLKIERTVFVRIVALFYSEIPELNSKRRKGWMDVELISTH